MKPGKLQKAGLLFRFWGWTGPSRDPDPAHRKAIWRTTYTHCSHLEVILDVLEDDERIKKRLHESSEPGKCWMLYFWLEFSTNTLENVQNVSLNSHDILVFCIHRASKNSMKCADLLQYFNPSTFINCTWSQKQRKMTIKTSKSRTMFAYNRAFAFPIHCYATFCAIFCLLYVFVAQHFDYYIHCYALFQAQT